MNIFILNNCPILSARYQHDRHVVKMILESAQMLSAACQDDNPKSVIPMFYADIARTFPNPELYKLTHANHPATKWVSESPANFVWLTIHMNELLAEYTARFNRAHKCQRLAYLFAAMSGHINDSGFFPSKPQELYTSADSGLVIARIILETYEFATRYHTPFVYCGPSEYRAEGLTGKFSSDSWIVESYRRYYVTEKLPNNRWTRHARLNLPAWLLAANPTLVNPKWLREPTRAPRRVFTAPKPDMTKLANPGAVRLGKLKF